MRRKMEKQQKELQGSGVSRELAEMRGALAEIAAESWRFEMALQKVVRRMDVMEGERFSRQWKYFADRVDRAMVSAGLTCLDLSGQPYDVGMAVQAMNLDEFGEDEDLLIVRMVEPVILWNGKVLKTGVVTLGRMETI